MPDLVRDQPAREETRPAVFVRGDIEMAAEEFVWSAIKALGLIWEPDDVQAEVARLTDAAFGWRDETHG